MDYWYMGASIESTVKWKHPIQSAKEDSVPIIKFLNPGRDSHKVSTYSKKVLKSIMRASGISEITITSTARTANDQARIMFENIERHSVQHQKILYGPYGDKVIDHYSILKSNGKSNSEIIAGMSLKITSLDPRNVSRHAGDPKKLNVIDIAPSWINLALRKKFEYAINSESRVSKLITPPKDPAYHLEIPQPWKTKMKISKIILFILIVFANTACATEQCIFSSEYFSENNYKNNQSISLYEWSNKNNEIKGILKSGHLFSIKHWSCTHNGTHAVLIVGPNLKEIPDNVNEYVLQLAKIALRNEDIDLLSKVISIKNLPISTNFQKIYIPNDEYSEFYISYSVTNEIIIIEIKLYQV